MFGNESLKKTGYTRPSHSKAMTGSGNPRFIDGRTLKPRFCEVCGKKLCKSSYLNKSIKCRFCKNKGSGNPSYKNGESLKETTYTPDFYLPKTNEYVEIKGWWRDDAEFKFNLFKKTYPNIKLLLLTKKELKTMGIL